MLYEHSTSCAPAFGVGVRKGASRRSGPYPGKRPAASAIGLPVLDGSVPSRYDFAASGRHNSFRMLARMLAEEGVIGRYETGFNIETNIESELRRFYREKALFSGLEKLQFTMSIGDFGMVNENQEADKFWVTFHAPECSWITVGPAMRALKRLGPKMPQAILWVASKAARGVNSFDFEGLRSFCEYFYWNGETKHKEAVEILKEYNGPNFDPEKEGVFLPNDFDEAFPKWLMEPTDEEETVLLIKKFIERHSPRWDGVADAISDIIPNIANVDDLCTDIVSEGLCENGEELEPLFYMQMHPNDASRRIADEHCASVGNASGYVEAVGGYCWGVDMGKWADFGMIWRKALRQALLLKSLDRLFVALEGIS